MQPFMFVYRKKDVYKRQGVGRTSFYKMKKQALGYLGFYFYEIVVPQAKDKRFKPVSYTHLDVYKRQALRS